MAADDKWYFTKEQLQNTPSRKCGLDADKELSYRQQAANFIQDMGQKLQVSQLCINTAIVYMHRFYMFHSFTHFPWNTIAAAAFFLAAKVEEQPRKLEHVIRIANHCLHREQPVVFDAKSEQYAAQSQDLVFNENVLLQTLGFDVAIDHPHTHVVRCCHLVRASIDLSKTSYFMASNSLHLTTMCLQYKPTVVACFCIHLASKWSNWQIPKSNEGKDWYYYVDKTVTAELLEQLTSEFLKIFDKCPSRLKRKITSISNHNNHNSIDQLHAAATSAGSPFDPDSRKYHSLDTSGKDSGGGLTFHRSHHDTKQALLATPETSGDPHKKPPRPHDQQQRADYREYREKKERERLEREKAAAAASSGTSSQHHKSSSSSSGSSSGGAVAGSSSAPLPVSSNKHLPPTGQQTSSKAHHRPPPAGIDPTKMKIHHRSNDTLHREHQTKEAGAPRDMTNGRGEGPHRDRRADYLQQQQQQQQQQQSRGDAVKLESHGLHSDIKVEGGASRQKVLPDAGKLPPKYDPNRHRRDLDPKYAQQKVPPPRDSVSSASAINDKQKLGNLSSSSSLPSLSSSMSAPAATVTTCASAGALSNSSAQDNKNFLNKQINSTSQRHKSPFTEIKPSVPAPSHPHHQQQQQQQQQQHAKSDSRNGSNSNLETSKSTWMPPQQDPVQLLEKIDEGLLSPPPPTMSTKKSSLFSPEKTPPQQQQQQQQQQQKKWNTRTPPNSSRRSAETSQIQSQLAATIPPPISPFGSPPPIQSHPKLQTPTSLRRSRTSSSGSEPELRPVVKKLDQISGFENIIRDSKMGIKLPKVPDIIQPICDRPLSTATAAASMDKQTVETLISKELKPPEIIKPFSGMDPNPMNPMNSMNSMNSINSLNSISSSSSTIVNGIETDPAAISTLLKEAVNPAGLVDEPPTAPVEFAEKYAKSEHHHKSEKKKKKDKHKHKDKDKGRDEKKKKHKDKDKERRKDKVDNEEVPLKITISKKNVEPIISESSPIVATTGLKVKISRDKIKPDSIATEALPPPAAQSMSMVTSAPNTLKIKISKDQIQYNSVVDHSISNNGNTTSSSTRKRDRDRMASALAMATPPPGLVPPTKIMKTSYGGGGRDSRQNGKNYYNKVLQIGEGDSTHLRLAESKYQSKGASKTS